MNFPAPHGDKLRALLGNDKLPGGDRPRVEAAVERYESWLVELRAIDIADEQLVELLVKSLGGGATAAGDPHPGRVFGYGRVMVQGTGGGAGGVSPGLNARTYGIGAGARLAPREPRALLASD